MRSRQSFEGFRFSEPSKFFHHSSSNPRLLHPFPYTTSNNPLSCMDACSHHRTTQPSLYPSQTIVFARSLLFMKPYWIKCKFQDKKKDFFFNFFIFFCQWVWGGCWKLSPDPELFFFPSQHLNSVVFWIHRLERIPKLAFTIMKVGACRGLFRMKQAEGPPICWSYWASRPQRSPGFTPWGSWTWAISPIKQV